MLHLFRPQRIRLGIVIKTKLRPSKRPRRQRLEVQLLENRINPAPVTYSVTSSSPTSIPLGDVKLGQTVTIKVNFTTSDNVEPNERTEAEHLFITGPGFER